jgi:hypothetical protein
MYQLTLDGPYYCATLGPATLDTCGGPVIGPDARVLRPDVRRELRGLYHEFVAAYREAAEKLRAGNCSATWVAPPQRPQRPRSATGSPDPACSTCTSWLPTRTN